MDCIVEVSIAITVNVKYKQIIQILSLNGRYKANIKKYKIIKIIILLNTNSKLSTDLVTY